MLGATLFSRSRSASQTASFAKVLSAVISPDGMTGSLGEHLLGRVQIIDVRRRVGRLDEHFAPVGGIRAPGDQVVGEKPVDHPQRGACDERCLAVALYEIA